MNSFKKQQGCAVVELIGWDVGYVNFHVGTTPDVLDAARREAVQLAVENIGGMTEEKAWRDVVNLGVVVADVQVNDWRVFVKPHGVGLTRELDEFASYLFHRGQVLDSEIGKHLVLSTKHLSEATASNMRGRAEGCSPWSDSLRFGYLVHAPSLSDDVGISGMSPEDLVAAVKSTYHPGSLAGRYPLEVRYASVLARMLGCPYIMYDEDGPTNKYLEEAGMVFDW